MDKSSVPQTIDEYIAGFPPEVQQILNRIRQTVKEAAPHAQETISYQIPTFRGYQNLVHFAAYKHHIGFYPSSSGIEQFKDEMAAFKLSKGTVQFPLDRPIPYDLIRRITEFRVTEDADRAARNKKK